MLHDPRREHGTLDHFIAWLETQPPDEQYSFASCRDCLATRYMRLRYPGDLPEYIDWPTLISEIHRGADPHKIARGLGPLKSQDIYSAALRRAYAAREERYANG